MRINARIDREMLTFKSSIKVCRTATIPEMQMRLAVCPTQETFEVSRSRLTTLVKESVLAWQLVAKRLGLYFDVSLLIAKAVWSASFVIPPFPWGLKVLKKPLPCCSCGRMSVKSYSFDTVDRLYIFCHRKPCTRARNEMAWSILDMRTSPPPRTLSDLSDAQLSTLIARRKDSRYPDEQRLAAILAAELDSRK